MAPSISNNLTGLVCRTFISGQIGMLLMYWKPELAPHVVTLVLIIAGRNAAGDFFQKKNDPTIKKD